MSHTAEYTLGSDKVNMSGITYNVSKFGTVYDTKMLRYKSEIRSTNGLYWILLRDKNGCKYD